MSPAMELFAMGPKREPDDGPDQDRRDDLPDVSLAPLDLGADGGGVAESAEPVVSGQHWWGELVRADVLAVASAGAVVTCVLGLPFAQFLSNLYFIPLQFSSAWAFVPVLVAAGVATVLGLGAIRQAFRQDAPTWVRVVGGAATLVGFLLLAGTAVTWFYVVDTGLMEQLRNF